MGQIQKYKLCTDLGNIKMPDIENKINELIKEGWQPFGPLSIIPGHVGPSIVVQAMILETQHETFEKPATTYFEPRWT